MDDDEEEGDEKGKDEVEEWQSEAVKQAIAGGEGQASEEGGAMDVDAAAAEMEHSAAPKDTPPAIIMPSQVEEEGEEDTKEENNIGQ